MRTELCAFSGYKLHPGHGKMVIRVDGRRNYFVTAKAAASHAMKRNPRNINWTMLYRKKHRKGITEQVVKKRTRKTTKAPRAIAGLSINEFLAKKNQTPEVRKAQREQAIRAVKEAKKSQEAKKNLTRKAPAQQSKKPIAKPAPKMKMSKGSKR